MIKREVLIFLIVGTLTVGIDFLCYTLLLGSGVQYAFAKAVGFIAGTVFAYFANRWWTFGHRRHASGSALRFIMLYALTLGGNVLVNHVVLFFIGERTGAVRLAFLFATGISAALNFLGMRLFVFRGQLTREA
ncbi:GtrA family protein [Burkholderia multivorans]|uniref:GtrA family protein n=1 Tax=Burkholderia multivorans TaxID=87883 RepID=UPI00190508D3|nr:GtrA family protein [Burkholderia multivorans]MBJ9939179.1 GtrA family protein [Burkholderia multivorans]MBU9286671.1 GtrA family protein [Burkholderia multivorans]